MNDSRSAFMKRIALLAMLLMTGCSSFELTSEPVADIYENGDKIGTTPYQFTLMSGVRTFTLKRYGYVEQDVEVTSLDSKKQHFNLQWVGRTQVDTQPEGAQIVRMDDGKVLGTTPCALFLSRPVDVLFRMEGFEEVERELIPNRAHVVELSSKFGFKSAYYRDILFTSSQGAVAIYDRVAGERIGVTPVRLTVEAGSALEYRMEGYKSKYDLVSRNAPHRVEIALEPTSRVVLSGPPGADVYRAGETVSLGQVPVMVEVDGSQLFELKKEGYYDRTVAVAPGSPPRVDVELEPIPYKTIVTDPPGADVYRLGGLEKLGTAPFTTIVSGECVFEIKKQGFQPYIVGVGPSSPGQLSVPLSPVPRDDPDAAAIGELDSSVVDTF